MKKQNVSDAVIRRLPRYYRYLDDLHMKGIVRISSSTLGEKMGITASQIRQDLSCFGEFGQQGYGYNVDELRGEIGRILGVDQSHRIIVVGVGNLGRALIQNFRFNDTGFLLEAAFDVSPALVGSQIAGVPVLEKVVAIFMAIWPAFPMPEVTSLPPRRPTCSTIRSIASAYASVTGIFRNASASRSTMPAISFFMSSFMVILKFVCCFSLYPRPPHGLFQSLAPAFRNRFRHLPVRVEAHHHSLACRLDGSRHFFNHKLLEHETLLVDFLASGEHLYLLPEKDRMQIGAVNVGDNGFHCAPLDSTLHDGIEEVSLPGVVEREIYGIVEMSEDVDVVEAQLRRHRMPE